MKKLYAMYITGILALFGIAVMKNQFSYAYKSLSWRIGKSAIDTSLVLLAAWKLPGLLVGWIVMWLTRPIYNRGVQITLSVIFGVLFGAVGGIALEVLMVLGLIAVDLLTGTQGIYGWWKQRPPETFMPYLKEKIS